MTDLPTAFRTAHEAIGDEIVPNSEAVKFYGIEGVMHDLSDAGAVDRESIVNRLIVHTILWLNKRWRSVQFVSRDEEGPTLFIQVLGEHPRFWIDLEMHDGTAASILTALLALATRVKQGDAK